MSNPAISALKSIVVASAADVVGNVCLLLLLLFFVNCIMAMFMHTLLQHRGEFGLHVKINDISIIT